MTVQEAKKEIIRVIKVSTETELDITEQTNMFTDMGLSSVEVVVMLGELEDTFEVEVDQQTAAGIRTVQEAVNYLEKLTGEE